MARAALGSVAVCSCPGVCVVQVDHHLTAATAAGAERSEISEKPLGLKGLYILVDRMVKWCYNINMNLEKPTRKKRVDRTHIIYELRVNGLSYIGVTAKTETTINKSVLARAAKHFYRAKRENKDWLLCRALRTLNDKSEIEVLVHETLRGKSAAHRREVALRREINPALNTDVRGD